MYPALKCRTHPKLKSKNTTTQSSRPFLGHFLKPIFKIYQHGKNTQHEVVSRGCISIPDLSELDCSSHINIVIYNKTRQEKHMNDCPNERVHFF